MGDKVVMVRLNEGVRVITASVKPQPKPREETSEAEDKAENN